MVFGLREVMRGIRTGKVKVVVVAPNIDQARYKGSLDDRVRNIIDGARAQDPPVPVVYALTRRKLGKAIGKHVRQRYSKSSLHQCL